MTNQDTNIQIPQLGFGTYFPLIQKWIIFNKYFLRNGMWMKNKYEYFKHELLILRWAYSKDHQHTGLPVHESIFMNGYGYNYHSHSNYEFRNEQNPPFIKYLSNNKELIGEFNSKSDQEKLTFLRVVIANIIAKGFATKKIDGSVKFDPSKYRTGRDLAYLSEIEIDAITFTENGYLAGELSMESKTIYYCLNFLAGLLLLVLISPLLNDVVHFIVRIASKLSLLNLC